MITPLEAAREYLDNGWTPVPLGARSKQPVRERWPEYRPSQIDLERDFSNGGNIGLLLGEASGHLVDVDLDCAESRRLADDFLPETGAEWGRHSAPRSHRGYVAQVKTAKFADGETMLVELRASGCQSMAPPSIHPEGEAVTWHASGTPTVVEPDDLQRAASRLAACSLVARHWPQGSRHETALALGGFLLRSGWTEDDATHFVMRAAEAAGDPEWRDRVRAVSDTAAKLRSGEQATGGPKLVELLGAAIVDKLSTWLGLRAQSTPTESNWPARKPLPALLPDVPVLDPEIVPAALRSWVEDVAVRMQCPREFIVIPALVGLGSVVGRQLAIHPKRRDRWRVISNLWGAVVAHPGALKTPAIDEGLHPLGRLIARAHMQYEEQRVANDARLETIELRRAGIRDGIKKAAGKNNSTAALERELVDLALEAEQARLRERRYVTSDPTVEKLGELLAENPRGLLLQRDELAGWLRTLERPGSEGAREFYLETWNGNGSFTTDRIKRGTVRLNGMCLSVFGGIQPSNLVRHLRDAVSGGAGDDGMLPRFQLAVYPDPLHTWTNIDQEPDTAARMRVVRIFEFLDALNPSDFTDDAVEPGEVPAVRFDDEGQELFDAWREALELRLRSDELELPLRAHLSKYRSLFPALALIFYLVEVADGAAVGSGVPARCAWAAQRWVEFLEAHAHRVYASLLRSGVDGAHALARRIERGQVLDGAELRMVYRHHWTHLDSREAVDSALAVLHECGWIQTEEVRPKTGRPSEVIRLHPDLQRGPAGTQER